MLKPRTPLLLVVSSITAVAISGCIFSVDGGTGNPTDAGAQESETGGGGTDGGPKSCNYKNESKGVCKNGVFDAKTGNCTLLGDQYVADESKKCGDGLDNDCDGTIDDGCACNYKGKKSGICGGSEIGADGKCSKPEGYVGKETSSHCDSIDNDCDGSVDEMCSCMPGDTEECYPASKDTRGEGECMAGERMCQQDGTWGECMGYRIPETNESCGDGIDNDCDGAEDEGCPCEYDTLPMGVCDNQSRDENGECSRPPNYEAEESACDSLDNDCDGDTDEGCTCNYMGETKGVCGGTTVGPNGCMIPANYEATETLCDGADNDCDGSIDEMLTGPTKPGGSCQHDCNCTGGHCVNGTCAHVVFVSSRAVKGTFNGGMTNVLAAVDGVCNTLANNAQLAGTWKAIISKSRTPAIGRLSIGDPVVNIQGDRIANNGSDLFDGSIANPVAYTENGRKVPSATRVWTGTKTTGYETNANCSDWTTAQSSTFGVTGRANESGGSWIQKGTTKCSLRAHFYCIDGQ